MTDELTRAAKEASEATGLEAKIFGEYDRVQDGNISEVRRVSTLIEVYAPLDSNDGGAPIATQRFTSTEAALAYLSGLSQGAHIANVRHEPLKEAAWHAADMQDADELGNLPYNSFVFARLAALANAVAVLDTNTEG